MNRVDNLLDHGLGVLRTLESCIQPRAFMRWRCAPRGALCCACTYGVLRAGGARAPCTPRFMAWAFAAARIGAADAAAQRTRARALLQPAVCTLWWCSSARGCMRCRVCACVRV
jgi:hypothetical protein